MAASRSAMAKIVIAAAELGDWAADPLCKQSRAESPKNQNT